MTNPTEALEYYRDKPADAMKFDGEKVRLDLIPVTPLLAIGKVLTYGAKKYSERNWEKGLAWSRCYAAALRHLFAWWSGETNDPETGLNHLDHALCEIMFLREFAETHSELDDRPKQEEEKEPPLTWLQVVQRTMPEVCSRGHGCPWGNKFKAAFTGYVQPKGVISCDHNCNACWNHIAEKEPSNA
ncbi:dATP/dGTP diphosphohydrolase domain-containing protein [Cloacibacillus porcorum]